MKIPDILTIKEVMALTSFPRSTLYHFIHTEAFPKPKKLGPRVARWSKKEVLEWMKNKGFDVNEA